MSQRLHRQRPQDDDAFVPSWRLREVTEEKRAAIAERDALRAERDQLIVEREKSRPRVYRYKQAADEIGCSIPHLRRLVAAKKIKAISIGVRRKGITSEEVARIIAEGGV